MGNLIDEKVDEAMKSIMPDSKKATSGTIEICGKKCRYKRDVASKKSRSVSVRIFIEQEIGFNGNGNAFEAVREAVIKVLNKEV